MNFIPASLTQFFFCDENGELNISAKQVRSLYNYYTDTLRNIYKNLRKKYLEASDVVADGLYGSNLDFPVSISEIQPESLSKFLSDELKVKLDLENFEKKAKGKD